ncbi:MAG: ABC transporter permease [Pseudomonadota bacterium]
MSVSGSDAPIDDVNRLQAFFYALQECVRSALSSIRSHPMRSFLTMLGVIIGVASVICIVSLLQGLTRSVMNELQGFGGDALQIRADTSREDWLIGKYNKLKPSDLDLVKYRVAGVTNVTPVSGLNLPGGVRNGSHSTVAQVIASTNYFQLANQSYPRIGRFITRSDDDSRRRVVVLGDKARTDLKLPDDPLGTFIQVGGEWFKIVGVMEPRGELFGQSLDNYVVIPFETGWALSAGPYSQPDMSILLTVENLDAVADVTNRVTALLRQAHKIGPKDKDDFKVESSQSLTQSIERISGTITVVISAVVGISLLVGGVGIMNIMLVSVTERTREIGIAKALGAPRSFILMQFLIEAMVLAVIGGIIGIGLGWLLGNLAANMIPHFPPPAVPWWAVVGATGFSALVGMLFGILPARRAANLAPIDALRHE